MSGPRWARSVTPTTMRCARASSPRSRPSSYSGRACEIRPRLGWPFSTSSRPGTIRTGDTRHSVSCRPSTTKGGTHPQLESLVHNCPLRGANSRATPLTGVDRFRAEDDPILAGRLEEGSARGAPRSRGPRRPSPALQSTILSAAPMGGSCCPPPGRASQTEGRVMRSALSGYASVVGPIDVFLTEGSLLFTPSVQPPVSPFFGL